MYDRLNFQWNFNTTVDITIVFAKHWVTRDNLQKNIDC